MKVRRVIYATVKELERLWGVPKEKWDYYAAGYTLSKDEEVRLKEERSGDWVLQVYPTITFDGWKAIKELDNHDIPSDEMVQKSPFQ